MDISFDELDELITNTAQALLPDSQMDIAYKAYDICLLDENDQAVQLSKPLTVRINIPDGYNGSQCHVYRLEAGNTFTDTKAVCVGNELEFHTEHFSVYVLTEQILSESSLVTIGDVNGDGEIDIADALLISRFDAGLTDFDEKQLTAADVNGDGSKDIADALLISRYDAGLIESL